MPRHRTKIKRYTHTSIHNHVFALAPFTYAQLSIACERHPHRNEDSILVDKLTGLVAVFDDVGGSAAGEIASQTAAHATYQEWRHILRKRQERRKVHTFLEQCDSLELCTILEHLIQDADERVRTEGAKRAGTDDLATTVAMATFCRQAETRAYTIAYAHVVDHTIYLLRSHNPLNRLTN